MYLYINFTKYFNNNLFVSSQFKLFSIHRMYSLVYLPKYLMTKNIQHIIEYKLKKKIFSCAPLPLFTDLKKIFTLTSFCVKVRVSDKQIKRNILVNTKQP